MLMVLGILPEKYGLIPFDWSMSNENDENWSYTFSVF